MPDIDCTLKRPNAEKASPARRPSTNTPPSAPAACTDRRECAAPRTPAGRCVLSTTPVRRRFETNQFLAPRSATPKAGRCFESCQKKALAPRPFERRGEERQV
eukprot:4816046-Prymnesium_polylepis.1